MSLLSPSSVWHLSVWTKVVVDDFSEIAFDVYIEGTENDEERDD